MAFYVIICILSISFFFLINFTILTAFYKRGKKIYIDEKVKLPKVSILKPVKNIDDEMEENIKSFYELNYPDFEIIFGMDSTEDECITLLEKIQKEYSNITTRMIETGIKKDSNPKIDALSKMAKLATGQLYWVSDSNTRAEKFTLKRLVYEYISNNSKIVFSTIKGTGAESIGSIIENAHLNFFVSGSIILAWIYARQQIIVGKSMLIEKEALDKLGGFLYFKEYLAEDFIMGEVYTKMEFPISTNFVWITNINKKNSIKSFISRHTRWAKMRFHIKRLYYLSEILLNPIAISIFSLMFTGKKGIIILFTTISFKIFLEYVNFLNINTEDRKKFKNIFLFPISILLKDILLFFVYISPFFSSEVDWRGRKIKIGKMSRIEKI
jgi:ceramide glucosyltransferase